MKHQLLIMQMVHVCALCGQIDFGMQVIIHNVTTWGRADEQQWVTAYEVSYSDDELTWNYVINPLDYHGR